MTGSFVTQIKDDGIAGEQSAHETGQGLLGRCQQQVNVIVEQSPGRADGFGFSKQTAQPLDKIFPILIIKKDVGSGDPSDNDMLQQAWDIDTSLAWHGGSIIEDVDFSTMSP